MFLILIAPHEGGHFLVAKLCGVRVIEFSVGAGTRLWSTTRNGTLYAIRLIPIIGYVRMGGMEAGDFEEPTGFHSRAPWQRIAILLAGPMANFVVAIVLITGFGLSQLNSDPGKVAGVLTPSAAATAGLRPGDHIKTVNGKLITAPENIQQQEMAAAGKAVTITGTHADDTPFTVEVTPVYQNGGGGGAVVLSRGTPPPPPVPARRT